jgi:hypothetical protein
MTTTRRQTPIGAAAMTPAAARPAVAAADDADGGVMADPCHRFGNVFIGCARRKWRDLTGRDDLIETFRALDEAVLIADNELVDFREIA